MRKAIEDWETLSPEFFQDGSLRDLYIFDANIEDWKKTANFIATSGLPFEFSGRWTGSEFPVDITSLFPRGPNSETVLLSIDLSGVRVNCHFFDQAEIEFDLCPSEVDGGEKLTTLLRFIKGLANAVGKDVVLTPENLRKIVIFRSRPGAESIEHTPFGGFE